MTAPTSGDMPTTKTKLTALHHYAGLNCKKPEPGPPVPHVGWRIRNAGTARYEPRDAGGGQWADVQIRLDGTLVAPEIQVGSTLTGSTEKGEVSAFGVRELAYALAYPNTHLPTSKLVHGGLRTSRF